MIKKALFKLIKDKNTRSLYEIIADHLNFLYSIDDKTLINEYQEDILSFINGYTNKNKMFIKLRKVPNSNLLPLNWLYEYTKYKIQYAKVKSVNRYEDLEIYFELQSTFLYFLLIVDPNAQSHINLIQLVGKFDMLSYTLLNLDELKNKGNLHLSNELLVDFRLETTIDNNYLKNDNFKGVWNLLGLKVVNYGREIKTSLHLFNDNNIELLVTDIVKTRVNELQNYAKKHKLI